MPDELDELVLDESLLEDLPEDTHELDDADFEDMTEDELDIYAP